MNSADRDDPTWQAAWAWVMQEHEHQGALPFVLQGEFNAWVAAQPSHRQVYEEAARLWLLVGLVPPAKDGPQGSQDLRESAQDN